MRTLEHPRRWRGVRRSREIMGERMEVLSWASLIVTGSTLKPVVPICCCFNALFAKGTQGHTVRQQFKYVKWSLKALLHDTHPTHDVNGRRYGPDTPEGMRAWTPLCGHGDVE